MEKVSEGEIVREMIEKVCHPLRNSSLHYMASSLVFIPTHAIYS